MTSWGVWRGVAVALIALGCSGGGATPAVDAGGERDLGAAEVSVGDVPVAPLDAPADVTAAPVDAPAPSDSALIRGVRADRPSGCPYRTTVTDTYSWAPPRRRPGACTATQIDALRLGIVNDGYAEGALRRVAGDACFSCAFSNPETDEAWGPVLIPSPSNPLPYLNVGGCMAFAGASVACGRASLRYQRCAYAACDGCEIQDIDTCVNDPQIYATGGACAGARAAYLLACQGTQAAYARCWGPDNISVEDWYGLLLTEFCGPAADGGM